MSCHDTHCEVHYDAVCALLATKLRFGSAYDSQSYYPQLLERLAAIGFGPGVRVPECTFHPASRHAAVENPQKPPNAKRRREAEYLKAPE